MRLVLRAAPPYMFVANLTAADFMTKVKLNPGVHPLDYSSSL